MWRPAPPGAPVLTKASLTGNNVLCVVDAGQDGRSSLDKCSQPSALSNVLNFINMNFALSADDALVIERAGVTAIGSFQCFILRLTTS